MKFRILFMVLMVMLLVLGLSKESRSQLTVNTGSAISMTPLQFVQTYLVGTGVTISNATYNGSADPLNSTNRTPLQYRDQVGSFTTSGGALTQLGIGGGVILSTGYVAKAIAPASPSDDMEGNNAPFESDPDLHILANSDINDKSVLEFDFIPVTNVITFKYVFSSIEFDGFCNSYNDAFGLFLSGPGIAGGAGFVNNAVNIALLPETTSYVNINNICAADKNNTGNGVYSWWNAQKTYFTYNRLTYVLTASYPVTCFQTYHMKFAIGDAGDGIYDSGVFIEENSFSSADVTGSASFSNPLTGSTLVEGCGSASLVYAVPQPHPTNFTVYLSIDPSGTANQADILPNPFPTEIVIPAGWIAAAPIVITAVSDATPEAIENLVIIATTTSCSLTNTDTTILLIKDLDPLTVNVPNKIACDGSAVNLTATGSGGQPILPANNYSYVWNDGETTQTISVNPPLGHTTYSVSITDACGQTANTSTYVDAGIIPTSTSPITGLNPVCTPANGVNYSIQAMTGADSYIWTVPAGAVIVSGSSTNTITVNFNVSAVSGQITVKGVNTICGAGPPVTRLLNISPNPQPAGTITGSNSICAPLTGTIYSVPPITGADTYQWTLPVGAVITSGSGTNTITVDYSAGAVSGNISVQAQSLNCGTGQPAALSVGVHVTPQPAGPVTGPTTICTPLAGVTYTTPVMPGADFYIWTLPAGATITSGATTNTITVDFNVSAVSGTVSIQGSNNFCGAGTAATLSISAAPSPQPAGAISGSTVVCTPAGGIIYSITPVTGATSYAWTLPAGAVITAGNNSNSITVDFDVTGVPGNITVQPQSLLCGMGQQSLTGLSVQPTPQAAGAITGVTTICTPATGITYSVPAITGATGYSWSLPAGATITSGNNTNTITVNFVLSAVSGTVAVFGHSTLCGNGQPSSLALTVIPSPQPAGSITGSNTICAPASGVNYTIPAITGANSYAWTLPAGASITAGNNSNSITVDYVLLAASGTISVQGQSTQCGNGPSTSLVVTVNPTPQPAGPVTGSATFCTPATGINYAISPIIGANSYTWTFPLGASITTGSGTNSVTVDFSTNAVSGTISVKGHSSTCGDGTPASLSLTLHPSPEAAGPISGASPVCQGTTVQSYSITSLAHTTTYDWVVPAGVTIVGGSGTNSITCLFTTSAASGNFTVRGYNAECSYGQPAVKPVVINPLPGPAGVITSPSGAVVCQGTTGIPYNVSPVSDAATYTWTYTGTGNSFTNNGAALLIDFSATATSGNLNVTGQNACGSGSASPWFHVRVNPKPIADFLACNDLKTTKNSRPILLKGGSPAGTGGVFSGTGISQVSPGVYVFDPANSSVVAGSTTTGSDYSITYRYTNVYNCIDEKIKTISVFASNANDPCPGTVKDYRDDQIYPTFLTGTMKCWTAANLNYGTLTNGMTSQTDNCLQEKYCRNNSAAQCSLWGGYYQWGELMQYQELSVYQDICPPGWHVPSATDWDNLITDYLGNGIAGGALKDTNNTVGFQGRLKGMLYLNYTWPFSSGLNEGTMYWTATAISSDYATARGLNIFNPSVSYYPSSRANAFAVRCLRN